MYKYYFLERPPMPGAFPKPVDNEIKLVMPFDEKMILQSIGRVCWGYIVYKNPLSQQLIDDYELLEGVQGNWLHCGN